MFKTPYSRHARRALLASAAAPVLAAMLAIAPAAAQTADSAVKGARIAASEQINRSAPITADASGTANRIAATGAMEDSRAALDDNEVAATARGNRTTQNMTLGIADQGLAYGPTTLAAGAGGLRADAGSVVAVNQRGIASPVRTDIVGAQISLDSGAAITSRLEVAGNDAEAVALANDAAGTIDLTGLGDSGAGIVGLQRTDASSLVAARALVRTQLATGAASGSDLALSGNVTRALGYGNSLTSDLGVKATDIGIAPGYGIASVVPSASDGDPAVNAAYAVLTSQILGGNVQGYATGADASDPFALIVSGDLDGSSAANDANSLVAGGYGNRSANSLALDAVSIARAASGEGPVGGAVANITNVQRIAGAGVAGTTVGGAIADVLGNVDGAMLSASTNGVRAVATGNLAEGNLLDVTASTIDAWGMDPPSGPVGTAQSGNDGSATVSAAFSAQNVQDYGTGAIGASAIGAGALLQTTADIDRSTLHADDNLAAAAATGNSALTALTLKASTLRASADVNNVQTGDGDVRAAIDSADDPAGATIAPFGMVRASRLTISGNSVAGSAIGNVADSSLTVEAGSIANGTSHEDAVAGPLPFGYGAAATFALANTQKLGQPAPGSEGGTAGVHIASNVIGRFAVTGDGGAEGSSLVVDGNVQRATSLGNSAANRLSVTAANLDDLTSPSAGSALSSAQYGQADVLASSAMKVAAKGAVTDSTVSLSGNSNQALAAINDVDNRLALDAVGIGTLTGTDTRVSIGTAPAIIGDQVLANVQFAAGTATAAASTRLRNGDSGGGLVASRFAIEDNATVAEASANRASNLVEMSSVSGTPATGIGNLQQSTAAVSASAVAGAAFTVAGSFADPALRESSVSIGANTASALARGNVADNRLDLATGATPASSTPSVDIGRFDASARAMSAVLNSQINYGSIAASTTGSGYGVPLNGAGAAVIGSNVAVTGNAASAAAYGNAASNTVSAMALGGLPRAAIANVQANYGPVTARVTGTGFGMLSGPLTGSAITISGNQPAAIATGNQATNIVTAIR